ncbi:MAG: hypothetical protein IPO23_08295 [Flavobacterium sp.]|jgi:hypothetical protein|nr:hypothetical protein [Flavobacterium sp.]
MDNQYRIKLIDSVFTPSEAGKVLISLINNKINYHNLEDFSNHIRFNNDLSHSKKRVQELNLAKDEIDRIVELAKNEGLNLSINSVIEIKLSK